MSFTEAEEDQLINIISKYPVIYDASHVCYRNSVVKENVWKSIGKELNKNTEDCKRKWKFLRDGYHRFKKKHTFGSAAPKNSKDQRHQLLIFLDGVSHHRSGGSNLPTSPQVSTEIKEDADQLGSERQVLVGEAVDNVIETLNAELREQTTPNEKRRKRNREDELLKMWKERDEKKTTLAKRDDDVELFSRHIAEVLRNLPPVEKAEAKKYLSLVLSDYEIKAARNASSSQSSLPLSHSTSSNFHAAASSLEYPSSMPASTSNLPGASSALQCGEVSFTSGLVHYTMSDACSPNSAMSASPEPTEFSFQLKQESEEG